MKSKSGSKVPPPSSMLHVQRSHRDPLKMSMRSRIPPSLEPYLQLPPETSLILLTGTLGCSPNWLTARYAGGFLDSKKQNASAGAGPVESAVVFVSWMRDSPFWKNELRRACASFILPLIRSSPLTSQTEPRCDQTCPISIHIRGPIKPGYI